ncbi:ATP-binding protein [Nostoc sp. NMS4]|uniref:ATP-binding protein n=1 Tax=Nostoc sp. NMS4 TaxID=2815390 RepID=UPI0025F9E946|nr:ATP-binding protein [Nostoc sp. NMS4]MBN3922178.1 sensor histidine kinase [Nostoc sp. NMS4]
MDEKLLAEILTNLLPNGIKYFLDDSIFKLNLLCQDGQAVSKIQDWQVGICEEDIPSLLESFYHTINVDNILGNGLEISILKKCIDIYNSETFLLNISLFSFKE